MKTITGKIHTLLKRLLISLMSSFRSMTIKALTCGAKKTGGLLVLRTDNIGDLILFLPFFEHLRQAYPQKRITLLINSSCREISHQLVLKGLIDRDIFFDPSKMNLDPLHIIETARKIARDTYSTVIYPVFSRTALGDSIVSALKTEQKISFRGERADLNIPNKKKVDSMYTYLIEVPKETTRELDRNLIFTENVTRQKVSSFQPKIEIDYSSRKKAIDLLENKSVSGPYCIIFPGAYHKRRIWPLNNYKKIIDYLCRRKITPIICGSKDESPLTAALAKENPAAIDLGGETNLITLAALIERSLFYFGTETGIMHLAAAVGTPVICLLGGGHFGRFFPYGDLQKNRIVYDTNMTCKGDGWRCAAENIVAPCIAAIKAEDALSEIEIILKNNAHQIEK